MVVTVLLTLWIGIVNVNKIYNIGIGKKWRPYRVKNM